LRPTNHKVLIFLTGCIDPAGMIYTRLTDLSIRKQQYISSINFYLQNTTVPILFVENSGNDISDLFAKEIKQERLEVITCNNNKQAKYLGKGFGEMLIIEYALANSRFFKKADFIFKITGRYKVLNIKKHIAQVEVKRFDLLTDLHSCSYVDSRFWGANKLFYQNYLLKYKAQINDFKNFYFEHALFKASREAISAGLYFSFLRTKPRLSGITGTDEFIINDSWMYWSALNIKYRIQLAFSNKFY